MSEDQLGPVDEVEAADFDEFFGEHAEARTGAVLRLFGVEYVLPASLPVLFTLQMERVRDSSHPDDIRRMLASLFGPDALDAWAEAGMTDRQLGIVLVWAAANCRTPGSIGMAEAARLYDEREEAGEEGKASSPNREQRRAAAKPGPRPPSSGVRS
ncbi:hypothetical protein HUT18_18295 [Streptomyces sp. NA04227]|uniref:hypothetical protein n=1 Tax=Streptomyces sp. NA04227 TaxID=2742136 RepID=UPI001590E531|nr:hypothetical protein [Streptomyces sp. NA04227]QKW08039.1 hypothetical protein HUT18_18295 [Streptomyces sp. NA04227]